MYKTHLIKPPRKTDDSIRYPVGVTKDIIETVLYADKKGAWYTETFAPTLKGKDVFETCKNIWAFVKSQIPYVVDPRGQQIIKSPGRLWAEKKGDCKSFSLFTASCLKNLGIGYGYRFASYDSHDSTPTHVYIFVPLKNGKEIIMDSVWEGPFNTQKLFSFKVDHLMTRISYLGAVRAIKPQAHVPGELRLPKPIDELTEGELDLLLTKQRLEIEKMNSAAVGGPYNWQIDHYDRAIGVIDQALANIDNPDYISGIGEHLIGKAKAKGKKTGAGKFLQKIGKGIKKGLKAVTKVVTAPLRLIAKGAMEIYLPKAAPAFLYLFADEKVLPDKMKAKRKKSEKFKNFIVKKIGMKEKHFMAIIRNKLTKNYRMSPEAYLAKAIPKVAIKGIGKPKKTKQLINRQKANPKNKGKAKVLITPGTIETLDPNGLASEAPIQQDTSAPKKSVLDVATKAASGNIIGAIIDAIGWLISKLGGKKEGVSLTAADLPDIEADSGNAFKFEELGEDYSNINNQQKEQVKDVATNLIENNADTATAEKTIKQQLPYLNQKQVREIVEEVEEGFEPITEADSTKIARNIKMSVVDPTGENLELLERKGGGTGAGVCNC
ncbi:MAG: hypothetical protein ACOYKE_02470 [Ferruginibacter sp.]